MNLTVKEKKSKILFNPEELFILREALENSNGIFYSKEQEDESYKNYGISVNSDMHRNRREKVKDKISKVLEASRVWDFEGFEYR